MFKYGIHSEVLLTPTWVLDPIANTYNSLVQELTNNGMSVYRVPYDWRKDNQLTASTTLANVIEQAKQETGSDQVDIVAHSMGGLVVRSYIEQLNKSDVRKFVMLGTPNRGSAKSYYTWEGGDFSHQGFWDNIFFYEPLIQSMQAHYHRENKSVAQFVQYAVPAMRQLLPVDTYLLEKVKKSLVPVPIASMHSQNQNNLIPFLNSNYQTLITNLGINNIVIFAGDTQNTIASITVKASPRGAKLWADGKPTGYSESLGDGTVLTDNAQLGGINIQLVDSEHIALPDYCKANVVSFLANQPLQQTQSLPESPAAREGPVQPQLAIDTRFILATSSPIRMGLTTAEGQRLGDFPFEERNIMEAESFFYLGNEKKTATLGVDNPSNGDYTLSITTEEPKTHYKILISYTGKDGSDKKIVEGIITRDDVKTIHIKINHGLEVGR